MEEAIRALTKGTWLERVQLARKVLAIAAWAEGILGVVYFLAFGGWTLSSRMPMPGGDPSSQAYALVSVLGGAKFRFDWVILFFFWAVLTLLLRMYEIFQEWVDEEEPTTEIE